MNSSYGPWEQRAGITAWARQAMFVARDKNGGGGSVACLRRSAYATHLPEEQLQRGHDTRIIG